MGKYGKLRLKWGQSFKDKRISHDFLLFPYIFPYQPIWPPSHPVLTRWDSKLGMIPMANHWSPGQKFDLLIKIQTYIEKLSQLVGCLEHFFMTFHISSECHDRNWLSLHHFSEELVAQPPTFPTFHILGIIIPTDFHIFQRGRAQPPTRLTFHIIMNQL